MKANLKLAPALALGLASLMYMVPANAADAITDVPAAPAAPMEEPPLNTWSGPYAGVVLGYGFGGDARDKTAGNSIDQKGFLGGGFAGYNYDAGGVVVGAEADIGYSGVKGDNAGTSVKSGVEGSLRARVGYDLTPAMVYATGGIAATNLEVKDATSDSNKTLLGVTLGAGVETKITESITARTEYRYTNYQTQTFNLDSGATDRGLKEHQVNVGLGLKF